MTSDGHMNALFILLADAHVQGDLHRLHLKMGAIDTAGCLMKQLK